MDPGSTWRATRSERAAQSEGLGSPNLTGVSENQAHGCLQDERCSRQRGQVTNQWTGVGCNAAVMNPIGRLMTMQHVHYNAGVMDLISMWRATRSERAAQSDGSGSPNLSGVNENQGHGHLQDE